MLFFQITKVTVGDYYVIDYTYDHNYRLRDGNLNTTTYSYDKLNRVRYEYYPGGVNKNYTYNTLQNYIIAQDENGNQQKYQYDSLGRLQAVYAINPANQGLVQLANITYDAISRKKTEALFKRYDDAGTLKEKYTTTYDYYTSDKIKGETTTDITGKIVSKYDYVYEEAVDDTINGIAAKYSKATTLALGDNTISPAPIKRYYDKMGFLVKDETVHNENGTNKIYTNTYKNDYLGNRKEVKEARAYDEGWPEAYTALYDYDYANRVVKETNALGKFIQTNYDNLGRVTRKSDYFGRFTNYTYDKLGRLIKVETPFEGSYTSKTKYYYDNNGNKTKDLVQSNVPGQAETYDRTDYGYDSRNRLIKAVKYDTSGAANYTQYSYDAAGNKTKMFTGLSAEVNTTTETGPDTNFSVTRYAYNFMNQMTSMTDPLGMVTWYSSDITGNVISMTDRLNITTYYNYNVNNQLLNQSVVKDGLRQEIQYTYDILGNRNSMTDETGTYYYTYDDLGRLKTQAEPGVITKAYNYDAAGNRKSFTLTKNGGTEISIQYTFDKLNRLSTVAESGQTTTYGYDDNGNRNTLSSTGGLATDYAYNNANKLTGLTNKKGVSILSQFAYTYYINGNMSGKTETAGTTSYAYDGLGRLKTETQPGSVVYSYLYDDYHNRSTMTVTGGTDPGTTTYNYDKNNRLLTETKALATGATEVTRYQYDNNGNQIYKGKENFKNAVAGEIERFGAATAGESENNYTKDTSFYEYDGLNRLTKANAGGHAISYKYNGDGLRMSKNVDGTLTYHVWDGSNMVMEMNGFGAATGKYIRGINLISGKDAAGTVQYYLFNGHGDVTSLTDSAGNVKKNYTYDAFGNEKNPDLNDTNVFRYSGEYFDKETGTIYLRARYYDPRMGRFVTEDSVRGSAGDPLSLNLYTYTYNNPINLFDPTGHLTWNDVGNAVSSGINKVGNALKSAYNYISNNIKEEIEDLPIVCYIEAATGKTIISGEPITTKEALNKALNSIVNGLICLGIDGGGKFDLKLYRGGNVFKVRPGIDVKINKSTGLIGTDKGVSLNIDPSMLEKYGGAFEVKNLPDGLTIIQKGKEGHYEIVPTEPMTISEYQDLLNKVELIPKE